MDEAYIQAKIDLARRCIKDIDSVYNRKVYDGKVGEAKAAMFVLGRDSVLAGLRQMEESMGKEDDSDMYAIQAVDENGNEYVMGRCVGRRDPNEGENRVKGTAQRSTDNE